MKRITFFALSIMIFKTMHVCGMDRESITKVTPQEISTLLEKKAYDYQRAMFASYTASGKFLDGHINPIEVDYDILLKEQVIPLLIAQRIQGAKAQGIAIEETEISNGVTAQVHALWNARKKTRKQ
ncbi:MAG: hypothetical protein AB7F19_06590 [Candidatus Babeliales bacterium]